MRPHAGAAARRGSFGARVRLATVTLAVPLAWVACAHPARTGPAAAAVPAPATAMAPAPAPRGAMTPAPDTARPRHTDGLVAPHQADSAQREVSAAEIVRQVTTVFGDSIPAPMSDNGAAPGAPVWDIDVRSYETHARVEYFVNVFSGRAKEPFARSLQRQTHYGPLIRQKLREGGLPEDLTYLALIESWFDPHAYSKAAAVGMWQFMAGTARGMGLRVDWWVDERRDPVRSTEAAVRLLRGLRDQFGSLYLAAAAYNGGDGRVSRGLARYAGDLAGVEGEDRFFTLADTRYLRPETRDYVPKLIAAALVGKEPLRYGVTVDSQAPLAFEAVRVAGAVPLAAIAAAAGTDVATIKDLNSFVLRGITPPGDSFTVRVPPGASAGFADRFATLDSAVRTGVTRHAARKGETIAALARRAGVTAKQLLWYNPKPKRLKDGTLVAGQPILIPARATVQAALDVPDPSIERYPKRPRVTSTRKGKGTAKSSSKVASRPPSKASSKVASRPPAKASRKPAPR